MPIKNSFIFVLLLLSSHLFLNGLTVDLDYSYDTNNFFGSSGSDQRQSLDEASSFLENRIDDNLGQLNPSGSNTWDWNFTHPGTGSNTSVSNPTAQTDTVRLFVGGRALGGPLGVGGPVGFSASGSSSWLNAISDRDTNAEFQPYAGVASFDTSADWYFDTDASNTESGMLSGKNDFFSVAVHEMLHALGIGGSDAWSGIVSGNFYTGTEVSTLFGGDVPIDDGVHFEEGLSSEYWDGSNFVSQEVSIDPTLTTGTRKYTTEMDFALMQDIGIDVQPVPEPKWTFFFVSGVCMLFVWRNRCYSRKFYS